MLKMIKQAKTPRPDTLYFYNYFIHALKTAFWTAFIDTILEKQKKKLSKARMISIFSIYQPPKFTAKVLEVQFFS